MRPPRKRGWPRQLAGDRAYNAQRIRDWLLRRRIEPVIPRRSGPQRQELPRPLNRDAYRRRNVVERCVNWLKENRRIATRYDKHAGAFMAFVTLAIIQRYLRLLDP